MLRTITGLAAALGAAFAVTACPPAHDPSKPVVDAPDASTPGAAWKEKSFSRGQDLACTQAWTCDCSALTAKAGCHLRATADGSTTGVCAADSGPLTACTRCMALAPPNPCTCTDVCP
jgi:hypothetical protein